MRRLLAAVLLALSLAGAAAGQSLPTPRDEREPNPSAVRQQERAAGVAPSPGEARREDQTVNQLFRELTGQSPNAPGNVTPSGTPAQDARGTDRLLRELLPPGTPGR